MQLPISRWTIPAFDQINFPIKRRLTTCTDRNDLRESLPQSVRDVRKEEFPFREKLPTTPTENPVIGIVVFVSILVGLFFFSHWLTQTIPLAWHRLDFQRFLAALMGR